MARKIGAWILLVLAIVGLILSISAAVGVWVLRPVIVRDVAEVLQAAGETLLLANRAVEGIATAVSDAQVTVDEVARLEQEVTARGDSPAATALLVTTGIRLDASVRSVSAVADSALAGMSGANRVLEEANRLPGVNLPTYGAEIERLDQTITYLEERLAALGAAIVENDSAAIRALTSEVSGALAGVEAVVDAAAQATTVTSRTLSTLEDVFPSLALRFTLFFSPFMALLAAGQWALMSSAWRNTK